MKALANTASPERLQRAFEDCHRKGAEEFGALWLKANDSAVQRIRGVYDQSDLYIKTLVSAVVLSTLRTVRKVNGF